jgi:hypothetical protein
MQTLILARPKLCLDPIFIMMGAERGMAILPE